MFNELMLAIAKQIGNVQSFQAGLIAQLTYARAIDHIAARQMLGNIEALKPDLRAKISRLIQAKTLAWREAKKGQAAFAVVNAQIPRRIAPASFAAHWLR